MTTLYVSMLKVASKKSKTNSTGGFVQYNDNQPYIFTTYTNAMEFDIGVPLQYLKFQFLSVFLIKKRPTFI